MKLEDLVQVEYKSFVDNGILKVTCSTKDGDTRYKTGFNINLDKLVTQEGLEDLDNFLTQLAKCHIETVACLSEKKESCQ